MVRGTTYVSMDATLPFVARCAGSNCGSCCRAEPAYNRRLGSLNQQTQEKGHHGRRIGPTMRPQEPKLDLIPDAMDNAAVQRFGEELGEVAASGGRTPEARLRWRDPPAEPGRSTLKPSAPQRADDDAYEFLDLVRIPPDATAFAEEVYAFCPDVADQELKRTNLPGVERRPDQRPCRRHVDGRVCTCPPPEQPDGSWRFAVWINTRTSTWWEGTRHLARQRQDGRGGVPKPQAPWPAAAAGVETVSHPAMDGLGAAGPDGMRPGTPDTPIEPASDPPPPTRRCPEAARIVLEAPVRPSCTTSERRPTPL